MSGDGSAEFAGRAIKAAMTGGMSGDVGAEVAAVLAAHRPLRLLPPLLVSGCTCGWGSEVFAHTVHLTTALVPLIAVRVEAAKAEAWDEAHAELCDYALAERGVITPLHRQNPYRATILDPEATP